MTSALKRGPDMLSQLPPYIEGTPIPAFFFAHGSPALLKEAGDKLPMGEGFEGGFDGPQAKFLQSLGRFLRETYRPRAIVIFSAHWETTAAAGIQIADNDEVWQSENLYYDYHGFPEAMYHLKMRTKTDAQVSRRVQACLDEAGIESELVKNRRGLDHGCFVPFRHMFGESVEIPVIEVSQFVSLEQNLRLGQALDPLRHEGILILSGGLTVHTFQDFAAFNPRTARQGYKDFEALVKETTEIQEGSRRNRALLDATRHEFYRKAHPTIEHFTPIAVAAGAGTGGGAQLVSDLYGAMSIAYGL